MDNKKAIVIMIVFGIIFAITGGTFAYFNWQTSEEQKTNITFRVTQNFSCAADGGGNITSADVSLAPATCTNSTYAIKRTVTVKPTTSNMDMTMQLWLNVDKLDSGLSNSKNFKYALTTSDTSCETGVVSTGTFNGKVAGDMVSILEKSYSATTTETYYLYIWLDKEETSSETMNQNFSLSLGGDCTNSPPKPNAPVLDENGMIPVVISDTGIVKTISSKDSNWYNYDEQKWANMILTTSGSRSKYLGTSGVTVAPSDILAYYVWIPRYKYRIPEVSCSTLTNPTVEKYPSCYVEVLILSDSDKELLINFTYTIISAELFPDYTLEEATEDVNRALQTGIWSVRGEELTTVEDLIYLYNEENPDNQITYTSTTEFSPSNILTGEKPIDIVFESKTTDKSFGNAVDTYYTHPAFTFGTTELSGIWVGKFETTGDESTPTVLPDMQSLRSQNVSTQFTTSLKFSGGTLTDGIVTYSGNDTYGLSNTTNSHMMKNSEWGAVAYLSHSIYGANREIYINNSFLKYTGRSGGNVGGSTAINTVYTDQTSTEQSNSYGFYTWDGYLLDYRKNTKSTTHDITKVASTTGNITGIYDMSGGAWEYVMGVLTDSNGNPRSGYTTSENSGFNGIIYDSGNNTEYTSGISFPTSEYYDLYTSTSSTTACNGGICYGHALSEIESWYGDRCDLVYSSSPWLFRGGNFGDGTYAGVFYSRSFGGDGIDNASWRSVLSLEGSVTYDPGFESVPS